MLDTGLAGRVCLVTGAASGIGLATAQLLAAEQARLVLWDIDGERLQQADVQGSADAGDTEVLREAVDIADPSAIEHGVATALERFGRIDALVHCAAIYTISPPPEVELEEWDRVVDINLRGAFYVSRAVCEPMREQGDGRIVLFGSFASRSGGLRASAPYAATKAGIGGLTRHLAAWGGPLGIRVNCIHPGFVETAMTEILAEDARQQAIASTPLRRLGRPRDIAAMAVVLASDVSSFVHGVSLDVNGGMFFAS